PGAPGPRARAPPRAESRRRARRPPRRRTPEPERARPTPPRERPPPRGAERARPRRSRPPPPRRSAPRARSAPACASLRGGLDRATLGRALHLDPRHVPLVGVAHQEPIAVGVDRLADLRHSVGQ